MKVLAISGSPRKQGHTATLLSHALEGARSVGAETELVRLYDLNYKGCRCCLACKKRGGPSYGHCAAKDGLTPLLEKIPSFDVIILGSPIYCLQVSGEMRSFLERLLYPYVEYAESLRSLYRRKLKVALLYSMGMSKATAQARDLERNLAASSLTINLIFGQPEVLYCFDAPVFADCSQYAATYCDPKQQAKPGEDAFRTDCRHAYAMGAHLAATE